MPVPEGSVARQNSSDHLRHQREELAKQKTRKTSFLDTFNHIWLQTERSGFRIESIILKEVKQKDLKSL